MEKESRHSSRKLRLALALSFTFAFGACGNARAVDGEGAAAGAQGTGDATGLPEEFEADALRFLETINAYRAEHGLEPLKFSIALTKNAQWMSEDMAAHNYMAHTDSLGRDFARRMADFGYPVASSYAAENVAAGNESAARTFEQWKNSPGHNRNMLNSRFRALGIGRAANADSRYRWYWSTTFGSRLEGVDELVLRGDSAH